MTLFLIAERELRSMARRKYTYRLRFFISASAMLLLLIFLAAERGLYSGKGLFITMSILAFVFSILSGLLLTADTLSSEKRAGTLGLLFLTDLRGSDVILGKLIASSVQAFYALLGVFPVLAMALLLGGVTGAEFFRVTVALVVAITFSLVCGLMISAFNKGMREAMLQTFLVILFFSAGGPLIYSICDRNFGLAWPSFLQWFSPGAAFWFAFDDLSKTGSDVFKFWASAVSVLILSVCFVLFASCRLPELWQEKPKKSGATKWPMARKFGQLRDRLFTPPKLLNDPFLWLGTPDASSRVLAWMAVLMTLPLLLVLGLGYLGQNLIKWRMLVLIAMVCSFCAHQLIKYLVTLEASRALIESRLFGTLELILTAPVDELKILSGIRKAMIKQFWAPIVSMVMVNLFVLSGISSGLKLFVIDKAMWYLALGAGAILLPLDCWALTCLGQWRGLRAKDSSRAIAGSLAWIFGAPWICAVIVFGSSAISPSSQVSSLGMWAVFSIIISIMSGGFAMSFLVNGVRPVLKQD